MEDMSPRKKRTPKRQYVAKHAHKNPAAGEKTGRPVLPSDVILDAAITAAWRLFNAYIPPELRNLCEKFEATSPFQNCRHCNRTEREHGEFRPAEAVKVKPKGAIDAPGVVNLQKQEDGTYK